MIEVIVDSKKQLIVQLKLAAQNAINGESTKIILDNPSKTHYQILKKGYDPEHGVKSIINNMKGMKEEEFEFLQKKPIRRGFFNFLKKETQHE